MKTGLQFIEEKEWQKALDPLKKVLAEDPDNYDARKALAYAYFQNRQFENSIDEYTVILKEYPEDQNSKIKIIDSHFILAENLSRENKYKESLQHYKSVMNEQNDYPGIKRLYYVTYMKYLASSLIIRIVLLIIIVAVLFYILTKKIFNKNIRGKHTKRKNSPF